MEPDRAWAVWFHRALETYAVPRGLGAGRLGRVFRDAEELAASSDLGAVIEAALDRSDWLIVVCSPRAKASRWVNAEIDHFRCTGKADRVLALLIDGEPVDAFPVGLLTLRQNVPRSGLDVSADPLAADARAERGVGLRERRRSALLSLAAAMLGVPLDTLRRRNETRARRRLSMVAAGVLGILALVTTLAIVAEVNRREASASQWRALARESLLLANLARQQSRAGDPVTGALLALRGLPRHANERPVVGETVGALIEALSEQREGTSFPASVSGLAISGDGKDIVLMANPGVSQLWEPSTRHAFPLSHEQPVAAAAFSPDGHSLATGDWDGKVKLWSRDGTLVRSFRPHDDGLVLLDFTADSRDLVTASQDGTAKRIPPDGTPQVTDAGQPLRTAAFDRPSGTLAAGLEDGAILLWTAGEAARTLKAPVGANEEPAVALDQGAHRLLAAWRRAGAAVFEMPSGRQLSRIEPGDQITSSALSPDGKVLVTGGYAGGVRVWSAATGELVADLPGHAAEVKDIRFAGDGAAVAVAMDDGTIDLWAAAGWKRLAVLWAHAGAVAHVAFTPDGGTLVSASFDDTVRLWTVRNLRETMELKGHTGAIYSAEEAQDGKLLLTGSRDGTVRLWNTSTGRQQAFDRPAGPPVFDAKFGPIAGQLTINAWDRRLQIWSIAPARQLAQFIAPGDAAGGMVSADGRFVVVADVDAGLRIVDAASGAPVLDWPAAAEAAAAFHPLRTQLLTAEGQELTLLELPSGKAIGRIRLGAAVSRVVFDSTGALVAAWQSNGDIAILDGQTLVLRATLPGHDDTSRVVLLPGCAMAITTVRPGRVRVWELTSGALRFELSVPDELPQISASKDCRAVVVTEHDRVRLIVLADGSELATLRTDAAPLRFARFISADTTLLTADEAGTLLRWPIPGSLAALIVLADGRLPRQLTIDQERKFGLR